MAVVIVPILDYIFGKQLPQNQILGSCLAAINTWALEIWGIEGINRLSLDDIISFIQHVMFGLGLCRMEAAMQKHCTEAGQLAAAQLLMVFVVSSSYLIGWSCKSDGLVQPAASHHRILCIDLLAWLEDPHILGMLLWTGVITTASTIWMETKARKTLSAAETTLIFSTESLFSA